MSLTDKHIIISGGGSGVGAELARAFTAKGAMVTILGRGLPALERVASETGATAVAADVTDRPALDTALAEARNANGPIFAAVANAGAAPSAPFGKINATDFQATLDVNLTGVFNLWQAAHGDMIDAGQGRLLAIASTAGLKGYAYVAPYCAAKHGVVGLTRALAQEFGSKGITVNAICPGFIETPLLDRSVDAITAKTGLTDAQARASLIAGNPQKRFVKTAEVAAAALWLCSEGAASVNGHALSLSGGEV